MQKGDGQECVGILVGEAASLKEALDIVRRVGEITNERTINVIKSARLASSEMWRPSRNYWKLMKLDSRISLRS